MSDQAADLRSLVGVGDEVKVKDARVIAVTSGKGGVGKSTLVANRGVHYARQGSTSSSSTATWASPTSICSSTSIHSST